MHPRRTEVADRLRRAREMAGLSQAQAATCLGLSRPAVTLIEAGRRRVAAEEVALLADLYGVRVGWLLGESPGGIEPSSVTVAARAAREIDPEDLRLLVRLIEAVRNIDKADEAR